MKNIFMGSTSIGSNTRPLMNLVACVLVTLMTVVPAESGGAQTEGVTEAIFGPQAAEVLPLSLSPSGPPLAPIQVQLSSKETITLEQSLSAIEAHLQNPTFPSHPAVPMQAVNERWPQNPLVIAFFLKAIANRSDEAIEDLRRMPNVWDESFVEPVVKAIESAAMAVLPDELSAFGQTRGAPITISSGLNLLAMHYPAWSKDTTIAPRLSRAVLTAYPALNARAASESANRATQGPKPGWEPSSHNFYHAMMLLVLTSDRAMIAVLRPFLANKEIGAGGGYNSRRVPFRVCDLAANGIFQLLGEELLFPTGEPSAGSAGLRNPQSSYPEWSDRDEKIAALEKRLSVLPKP